ncbi:MAG TPA: DMT family transporter [Kofleriaceae bacterium]|nr:DMT family transporter [Kofleriaceae bacterium]
MAASAFFFSLMSLFVKIGGEHLPAQEMVFGRSLVVVAVTWGLIRRAGMSIRPTFTGLLILRGLLGFAALSCFYEAITHLPIAESTVIQYTSPIFTTLLAALFLRERFGWPVIASTILGLGGVLAVARPAFLFGTGGDISLAYALIALGGAVLSGGAYVTVRHLRDREHPLIVVFYFPLVSVIAGIPGTAANFVMPTGTDWLVIAGIGITAQIAQVCLTRGLALETASRASAIGYLQIAFAAVWGILWFDELPGALTWVGAALIIGGSLAVALSRAPAVATARLR